MTDLFEHLPLGPVYDALLAHCRTQQAVNITGLPDALKTWLIWRLMRDCDRPVCFLVPDELRARTVLSDLRALADEPVMLFRQRDWHLTDADAVSHEAEFQRMAVLSAVKAGRCRALVVPAAATLQKLPPVPVLSEQERVLTVGDQLDPETVAMQLAAMGYAPVQRVDGVGQFARRGDILDFAPPVPDTQSPLEGIRLSFFDQEIDAIKGFDLESQRSTKMYEQALLSPVRELQLDQAAYEQLAGLVDKLGASALLAARQKSAQRAVVEALTRLIRHDVERLQQHMRFSAMDRWLPLAYPQAASILDYAQAAGALVVVDEPARFRHRSDAAQAEFHERIRLLVEKGQLLPETAALQFSSLDLGRQLDQLDTVLSVSQILSSGNGLPGAQTLTIQSRPSDSYRGREKQLLEDLHAWRSSGGSTFLFSGSLTRSRRLEALIGPSGPGLQVLENQWSRGFVWQQARLWVLGTHDLFGTDKKKRRRREQGLKIDLLSDLVAGERVVHDDHGIGRYDGLVNLESQGARRDYLKITYAGNDTLFIPMERLDQIQKYVGSEGRQPKLSKLGGQEWTRMKERARSSIRQLAVNLIELYAARSAQKGHVFLPDTVWQQEFEEQFQYEETQDQLNSITDIKTDMESDRVMDRLLCGDVGYGKTEVAFRALFKCVMSGYQGIFLSPTTVLAQQHYDNLTERLSGFPVSVGLLSRFVTAAEQKKTLEGLRRGAIDIVIGTHRLLSKDVLLKKPGLLVVDEEQRFGVDHKEQLKAQWPTVDVLTLSATPIPRTLHMAMSGIRDISLLEEAPDERRPVQTYVMEFNEDLVTEAILREIARNGQVFYLYNDTRKIRSKAFDLEQSLPGLRVAVAHGRMGERQLEEVIGDFVQQAFDVLVCTTIIESGIDMPNVNTIIVEQADRMGLAQLYQLRGRVGRSSRQAYAYITYQKDKVITEVAQKRLAAIRDFTELGAGFKIALRDLEVRGAGNLLGAEQHGHLESIGYDLYTRMLEETVRELQGVQPQLVPAATVDLQVDAFVPQAYVSDEGQRMDLYRRIAQIGSRSDHEDLLDECLDRYGDVPLATQALMDVAYIRSAAGQQGFIRVEQKQQHVVLTYDPEQTPDMEPLSRVINQAAFRGQLLFHAGSRPHLLYRGAAADRQHTTAKLRTLFFSMQAPSNSAG